MESLSHINQQLKEEIQKKDELIMELMRGSVGIVKKL
jgi:hypothetical protein